MAAAPAPEYRGVAATVAGGAGAGDAGDTAVDVAAAPGEARGVAARTALGRGEGWTGAAAPAAPGDAVGGAWRGVGAHGSLGARADGGRAWRGVGAAAGGMDGGEED